VAPEDVAQVGAVRHSDGLVLDHGPGLGVGVQREKIRVAIEREDDVLKDVDHGEILRCCATDRLDSRGSVNSTSRE